MRLWLRYYWLSVIPVYCILAFFLLLHASPISIDGSGATATFYWGQGPSAPMLEEYRRDAGVRFRFLRPYGIAAVIVTLLGCGCAPWLTSRLAAAKSHRFVTSAGLSLLSLLFAAGVSDAGQAAVLWRGPRFYFDLWSVLTLLKVAIPVSLVAGALTLLGHHLDERNN